MLIAGLFGTTFSLASPKSASFTCPVSSTRILDGFKSLYNMSKVCRYSRVIDFLTLSIQNFESQEVNLFSLYISSSINKSIYLNFKIVNY